MVSSFFVHHVCRRKKGRYSQSGRIARSPRPDEAEAHDIMKKQALDVLKEKEAFDSVAKKLKHVHFASVLKLNVGGTEFTTSLQTLTKDTGSTLHAMFSGRFDTKPTEDG